MRKGDRKNPRLWVPDLDRHSFGDRLGEVVDSYSRFLEVCYADHFKLFTDRLKNDPDAAKAEAIVFSWLRAEQYNPHLAESVDAGGIDFFCTPGSKEPFFLEVTHLDRKAVEKRSGWPDQLDDAGRTFSRITPNLWSKAKSKAFQLGRRGPARILAVCLNHVGASALLGTLAVEWLMTSQPRIAIPIALDGKSRASSQVTDLRNAAFLAPRKGKIVPVRQSISAILLIATWEDRLEVLGMLHPKPAIPFDHCTMEDIPFLRLQWPIVSNQILMEWVIGHPASMQHYHSKVVITDEELRGSTLRASYT